jgi:DNA invertase Pin-like site-specific DNA recombinase
MPRVYLNRKNAVIVGYARVSTTDQAAGLDSQLGELQAAKAEKIFQEQVSAIGQRKALDEVLEFVREGDVLIVTKLDRLARSVPHLCQMVEILQRKRVTLRILNLNLDTATPTGKLMLNLLASVAAFELEIMKERQRIGIDRARAEGKYRGRIPTAQRKAEQIMRLLNDGLNATEVAKRLFVSRSSVYRIKAMKAEATQQAC